MNARRVAGTVAGGLLAGPALSAVMLAGESASGTPSELIGLERKAAAKLDIKMRAGDEPATFNEQATTHGGHLALSALGGLAYAATKDEDADGTVLIAAES